MAPILYLPLIFLGPVCLYAHFVLFQPRKKAKYMAEDSVVLERGKNLLRGEVKWVSPSGTPSSEGMTSTAELLEDIDKVLAGDVRPLVENLSLRDPESFRAGEIHAHPELWKIVSAGYIREVEVNEWISKGVDVRAFFRPFKGRFKGVEYDCPRPPPKAFKNHPSCKKFADFITETLNQRINSGAVTIWGKIGEVAPPHIILPITVEPVKPRLCIDARFLNLWMKDTPFSLDKLIDVPCFAYRNSFMSKIDDKSGYDHVLLTKKSTEYFGIEWGGLWWVCTTLPFGWKNSPYVYQTIGLVATNFFRQKGIACSLYIDDRLNGELFTKKGFWSRPVGQRNSEYSYRSAEAALYIVCKVLTHLGYFLGLTLHEKSSLSLVKGVGKGA